MSVKVYINVCVWACVCVGGHVSYRPTYLEFRNNDSWGQDVLENNRSYELLDA